MTEIEILAALIAIGSVFIATLIVMRVVGLNVVNKND